MWRSPHAKPWPRKASFRKKAVKNIKKKARFDVDRILEIEEKTKHDVIAFLTNVEEYVGPDSRFIHMGLTSSDILDTSFAMLLKEAMALIIEDVKEFMAVIKERAFEHKNTVMIGRSHGIHAEPITFGLKLAVWYAEMNRNLKRLEAALDTISYGKLSGAVGTFANVSPESRPLPAGSSGLSLQRSPPRSFSGTDTPSISRPSRFWPAPWRRSPWKSATSRGRKCSRRKSLLKRGRRDLRPCPTRRIPSGAKTLQASPALCGPMRLAAMENMALWHERDISHSSVERVIGPDSTILIDYMLHRLSRIVKNLVVYPDHMIENLNKMKGLIYSQQVLLKLADLGLERQEAYEMVQRNALKVWDTGKDFQSLLLEDKKIMKHLKKRDIAEIFSLEYHLKHVDDIFQRVFG